MINTHHRRTCFVLHAVPMKRIFVWVGDQPLLDRLQSEAQKFAVLLQKYFSPEGTTITTLSEEEAEDDDDFQDALDLCPVEKVVKEDPYPDIKNLLKKQSSRRSASVALTVSPVPADDGEMKEGDLFEYPSLEQLTSFDPDDLQSDCVYVLQPKDPGCIYVWVGEEALEERKETLEYIGEDAGKVFISKKCLGGGTKIVVVEQDSEPDEFWDYF
jgi:hypothetical protein